MKSCVLSIPNSDGASENLFLSDISLHYRLFNYSISIDDLLSIIWRWDSVDGYPEECDTQTNMNSGGQVRFSLARCSSREEVQKACNDSNGTNDSEWKLKSVEPNPQKSHNLPHY
jgi:hypothetical protein